MKLNSAEELQAYMDYKNNLPNDVKICIKRGLLEVVRIFDNDGNVVDYVLGYQLSNCYEEEEIIC